MKKRTFVGALVALVTVAAVALMAVAILGTAPAQWNVEGPAKWRYFDQHITDPFLMVARGNFVDAESINQFGRNPDIDAGVAEDVWETGGNYIWQATAQTLTIVSTSVNDDGAPAGTGLWNLIIYGLDANFDQVQETVTLDGTTPVVTTQTFLRTHLAVGFEAGTTLANAGAITATYTTTGDPAFTVPAFQGRTTIARYTVPAGHTLMVTRVYGSISRTQSGTAELRFVTRDAGRVDAAALVQGFAGVHSQGSSWVSIGYTLPAYLPEKTDVKIRATAGANNTDINAGFDAILVRDPQ